MPRTHVRVYVNEGVMAGGDKLLGRRHKRGHTTEGQKAIKRTVF